MASQAQNGAKIIDGIWAMPDGVNMGISPLMLQKTQMASGTNVTVRGTLVTPRPVFRRIDIDLGYPNSAPDFLTGKYQGGGYYKPDNGFESLMFQVNGKLFQVTPGSVTASFIERTIPGDPNPISPDQAWMWQSEKWMLINDGQSTTIIFDQSGTPVTRRSTWGAANNFTTWITGDDSNALKNTPVPAVGQKATFHVNDNTNMNVNDTLTIKNLGTVIVTALNLKSDGTTPFAGDVTVTNQNCTPGKNFLVQGPLSANVSWTHPSDELPPGRMGAYVLGINWITLLDGRQFFASDQVGASSGTVQNNFRDSVLHQTQNLYLAGGGNFAVPGTNGDIRAMASGAILDASLGQGALQVFTPNTVFSVNVPTDRTTWQDVTNPILTESVISNGALGQWAVVNVNSDFIYRSIDGMRSYLISRRDFNTWGSTPISREVDPILSRDPPSLLQFCSGVNFNNRLLMTAQPIVGPNGIYWQQIIALNLDPVSSLRGKAPSVYDGSWTGLNVFQLIKGQFSGIERCFSLCYNAVTGHNELYEILKDGDSYFDNDITRITSVFQTAVLLRDLPGKSQFDLCRLLDGEIFLDSIRGATDVQVWYQPDSYPCWVKWTTFTVCNPIAQDNPDSKPGYRTRIGLGEPSGVPCEPINNRPYRTGYWFRLRFVITGPYRFLGCRIRACIEPQPDFAKPYGCCIGDNQLQPAPGTIPTPITPTGGEVIGVPPTGDVIGGGGDVIGIPGIS